MSARELARFVGKASATIRAIQAAPLHYRALQSLMNSALPPDTPHLAVEKFRARVELSSAARADLKWWSEQPSNLQTNGAPILPATPALVIESDASSMGWGATNCHEQTGGAVVDRGSSPPYQLLGANGRIPGIENICQGSESMYNPVQVRQCNSSDTPQSEGRGTFQSPMPTSVRDLGLVPKSRDYTDSRTSPRAGQYNSRPGVKDQSRPERLETQFISVPSSRAIDGSAGSGPLCNTSHSTPPLLLQLAARSGGGGNRCLHTELGSTQGLCQPSLVPYPQVFGTSSSTGSENSADNSLVDYSTLVPSSSGNARGLPLPSSQHPRSSNSPSGETVHNGSGSPTVNRMAHLRSTFSSQGLSSKASELLLSSWRSKTNQSYNSLCSKWISWCQPRDRNPFEGPVSDVVNFLAELHSQGYKYRSLTVSNIIYPQQGGRPFSGRTSFSFKSLKRGV